MRSPKSGRFARTDRRKGKRIEIAKSLQVTRYTHIIQYASRPATVDRLYAYAKYKEASERVGRKRS